MASLTLISCVSVEQLMSDQVQTKNKPSRNDSDKHKTAKNKSQLGAIQGNIEGIDVNQLELDLIIDPMADIQINAEIKRAYLTVSKLNQSKKYIEGIKQLDLIKQKYPQLSGPDYQKARLYLNQSKLSLAIESIGLSLKNNYRNYYSLNLKGVILKEMGKFKQAKNAYLKAIEIYPPYPNAHLNLGVLSDVYTGELDLALIQYKEYLKLLDKINGAESQFKKVENWVVELERRIKQVKK